MKTFNITLSNFYKSNTILLTTVTVYYIHMTYLFFNWKFVPLAPFIPFVHPSPHPCLWQSLSVLCIYELGIFFFFFVVCFFLCLTYFTYCNVVKVHPLSQMARFHSFLWLNNSIFILIAVFISIAVEKTVSLPIIRVILKVFVKIIGLKLGFKG